MRLEVHDYYGQFRINSPDTNYILEINREESELLADPNEPDWLTVMFLIKSDLSDIHTTDQNPLAYELNDFNITGRGIKEYRGDIKN